MDTVTWFYRVSEFVTSFKADSGENDSFFHFEDFTPDALLNNKAEAFAKARERAVKHYFDRLEALDKGQHFLPFEERADFKMSENAAYSCNLALVKSSVNEAGELQEIYSYILGESEEEIKEGLANEANLIASFSEGAIS